MAALRYIYRLGLSLWLGSIFFFAAAVAPALFRTLSSAESAGVVGRLIPFLDVFGLIAGPVLVGLAAVAEGRPRGRTAVRAGLLGAMSVLALVSLAVVTPKMEGLRAQAGSISALAPDDPLRHQFGMLHGVSTLLMLGEALCGLVALGFAVREPPA